MARLARKTSKLFAENATATNIGQFGSLNAGTKVETNDIATIQALPAWGEGWEAAGLGQNCYPTLQERNGLDYVQSYMTNYLYQEGIPEWDNNTTYYIGSLVKLINGTNVQLYQSIVDNNTAALSDSTAWTAWNYANLDLSNLSATGESHFVKPDVAVTHTQNTAAGTSSRPVYVNSSGVATACSGIDTANLCCTTKATTTSSASSTKPAVITQNYKSGSSWYRVWSDGWIEQGGTYSTSYIHNLTTTISFTKPFSDKNFIFVATSTDENNSTAIGSMEVCGSGIRKTKYTGDKVDVRFLGIGSSDTPYGFCWYACGY